MENGNKKGGGKMVEEVRGYLSDMIALVNKNWTEKIKICTIKTKTQTESERE